MKPTRRSLFLGVITSAGVLASCGGGTPTQGPPEAPGTAGNGAVNEDQTPTPGGGAAAPGAMMGGADTDGAGADGVVVPGGVDNSLAPETNPPVTGAIDGDVDTPSSGSAEPTDCVIPALAAGPIGYGSATTGGGGAAPLVVSSFEEAEAALAAYRDAFDDGSANALVLRYTGTFDYATITDVCTQHTLEPRVLELKEMSNVTFEGAPGSSANFGLHINRAKNVIVRNMTMGLLPGGDGSDAITIEGNGTNGDVENVWIDHNELFSSTKEDCDGAGDTEFDGLIDIKKGARFITVSFNFLHDHQKTGLIGFSDDDDTERYVTFHHNRYENVVSRTPLHRFGYIHLFNNYYGDITGSGINVRMGGVALIESNFFERAANPITSRFSDVVGFWDLRNNHVGEGITWTTEDDTLANAEDWQSTTSFPASELQYAYTPDAAACVKQIVMASAGATLQ